MPARLQQRPREKFLDELELLLALDRGPALAPARQRRAGRRRGAAGDERFLPVRARSHVRLSGSAVEWARAMAGLRREGDDMSKSGKRKTPHLRAGGTGGAPRRWGRARALALLAASALGLVTGGEAAWAGEPPKKVPATTPVAALKTAHLYPSPSELATRLRMAHNRVGSLS